ncbi:MAG: site-specific integrase [Acidimicrobiia bacterium]|nr:site-specific integrase [Acidimicrobiia bacterium]
MARRPWGNARKLPSGRWQARYQIKGIWRTAPETFRTKGLADSWLAATRTDLERGNWIDPEAGKVPLADYATTWLNHKPDIRPRTRELYEDQLRLHILPTLGAIELTSITPVTVRTWRADKLSAGTGASAMSKCYRLLHAIFATALEDSLVPRNPCVIKGASVERPKERPIASIEQVYALADAIAPRWRAIILLATFCGLRQGELRALRRRHIDLDAATVTVAEQYQQLRDGTLVVGPPKTEAGIRTVAIPAIIVPDLAAHLDEFTAPGPDSLIFPGEADRPFRTATLHQDWTAARRTVGVEGLHFHDLRHTGNTLTAATGASTKELMARMGHASPRAALIYQHATRDRDAEIAAGLSNLIEARRPSQ